MDNLRNKSIRIGAVSYLNSKPLIEELDSIAPDAELVLDYPSCLADSLAQRELDVALIPSIEFLRNPSYEIISDACVATHGQVMSVKLFSHVAPENIRLLALDSGSRTSVALVQILLSERYGIAPETTPLSLGSQIESSAADAILLIGDRAMHKPAVDFHTVWDLGEEWTRWTGLPFVFALWAARRGTYLGDIPAALQQARDRGLEQLPDIAEREAALLGVSQATILAYLTDNLYFRLGSEEEKGLALFCELAEANSLLENASP